MRNDVQKAIDKLVEEINRVNDDYTNVIGEYLIDMLNETENEELAYKILAVNKSIAGSLKAMEEEAKKAQKKGMAIITPKKGFEIVMKYFEADVFKEIEKKVKALSVNKESEKNDIKMVEPVNDKLLDLDLDDLL